MSNELFVFTDCEVCVFNIYTPHPAHFAVSKNTVGL